MKKIFAIPMLLLLFATLSCQEKKQVKTEDEDERIDSLLLANRQKDAEINDMLSTFNEIQEGLRLISETEDQITILKDDETGSNSERIKASLQAISNQMKLNRDLLAKLRQQLRESSTASEQMKKSMETLTQQLETKEQEIAALRDELQKKDIQIAELDEVVDNLNSNVNELTQENTSKAQTISTQDKALNTAWYVFGTKKELKAQNIIDGDHVLRSNFNQDYFTKIDIRVDKEIKLYSKSAKILTAHPESSYTLTQDANKQYILRIQDADKFWSTSKYLVVVVK